MNRRALLHLVPAALCARSLSYATDSATLKAGPFEVSVPKVFSAAAIIEKVPFKLEGPKLGYSDRPQHWAIRFPAAALPGQTFDANGAGENEAAPQILIHKAEEWSTRFTLEGQRFDRLAKLRAELDGGIGGTFPEAYPAFGAGAFELISMREALAFRGGRGLRMVCQRSFDRGLVRRGRLQYLFCGLSDDDSCQILATFPLDHPDLPDDSVEAEHLGRSVARYEELVREFETYSAEAAKWLEQIADGLSPSLDRLDGIVQSLEAKRWE